MLIETPVRTNWSEVFKWAHSLIGRPGQQDKGNTTGGGSQSTYHGDVKDTSSVQKNRNWFSILIDLFRIFTLQSDERLILSLKLEIFTSVMYRWVCRIWIAASGRMAQQALFLTNASLPWPSSITHWCPSCSSHPQPIKRPMVISTRHH